VATLRLVTSSALSTLEDELEIASELAFTAISASSILEDELKRLAEDA
jgi:hypothetical protein